NTKAAIPRVPPIEHAVPHATLAAEPTSSSGNVLKWIVIVAIIALAAWWLLGRNKGNLEHTVKLQDTAKSAILSTADSLAHMASKAGAAVGGTLNEAGDWVYNLGGTKDIKLPDGASISVGENSAESKLVAFIEDA